MISARWDDREYGPQSIGPMPALLVSFLRVWPWLKKAIAAYGPTHRKRHVWQRIASEEAQLWTNETGAVVTTIEVWPTGFKELSGWLSAGDLPGVMALKPIIERWAKSSGCERATITGRDGWRKPFSDYRRMASVFVKEL